MSYSYKPSTYRHAWRISTLALAIGLSACADQPLHLDHDLEKEAMAGTEKPAPVTQPLNTQVGTTTPQAPMNSISTGTGQFVQPTALAHPRHAASGKGAVTFNFENQ